jgi:Concanavalin A-like lectin/glucanases superfamily/Putative Ig domain
MNKHAALFIGLAAIIVAGLYFSSSHSRLKPGGKATSPQAAADRPGTALPNPAELAAPASTNSSANPANQTRPPEPNPGDNPYAAALREPGKSKRAWNLDFLKRLPNAADGQAIRFELTEGRMASGTIRIAQYRGGEPVYVSGELTEPEKGKFFFLTPPLEGKAGKAVGVVEFPASRTAYRIEPTGPGGAPELWQRRLDEVICMDMPRRQAATADAGTNNPAEMPPLRPDNEALYAPSYNSNIVALQSYPGSSAVLLLDFFGGYTPTWGGVAYSKPANVNNTTIKDLWKRVAEDYMPFNINVTTDIKIYLAAPANSRQRCCFTDTPVTAAGVAYIGSWNWGNDTPCWSVYTSGKDGAEVGAHEPGHTLGLGHQTQDIPNGTNAPTHVEYYAGQGSGAVGWAPIMGVGYYQPVATWAKGEYQYAGNTEDELAIITSQNNNVAYRPDDTGNTLATARSLEIFTSLSASAEGVIERTGDTDAFRFTTSGGQVTLTANPVADWADLALKATLADASDTIIASNNPQSILSATISSNLPAGTYTFRVTGAGRNNPLTNGFSAYASLGYYSIAGWVTGGRLPARLSVVEHSANGTLVGTVPASSSTNLLAYTIISGNTGNTFSVDPTGAVHVANNTLLDYNRLATNTMLAVQFELFMNITNLDDPIQTELNRRVVISVLSASAAYPIAVSGFNAGVIAPCNATAAAPRATAFDIPNNWCFYQAGLNGNPAAGGSGGAQGLPSSGTVLSQADGTTFQLGPYGGNNALLLGSPYPTVGTLTFTTPQAYNSLAILATSANGGGNGTFVLHFSNGANSATYALNAQDWYNTTTNVALQGFGRLRLGQSTLSTEDAGWSNPNLYQTTLNLAALGSNQPIASITFTKPGSSGSSGIFAISGATMPAAVSITHQPQSTTNVAPAQGVAFSLVAMGATPLRYQWYYSANGNPGTFAALPNQTNASLALSPALQTTNAGFYYAVVTNAVSAATSSVAALTIYRAPQITRQPAPTNLVVLAGTSNTLSVAANAALPVYYFWRTNGTFLPGATSASLTFTSLQVPNSASYNVVVSNAYGAVTSGVVALTVLAAPTYPYAQLVLANHPIAYWRLDETTGSVAYDCVAGNNGIYNKVLLGQPGNALLDTHKVARFGSLASANSMVTNLMIDFATSSSATFSIEAWVNGGAQGADNGLVTKGTGGGGEQFNLDCGGSGHAFRFFVRDSAGSAHLATSSVANNNQWHHLVGVCDQVHSNVVLYVDGANAAQTTIVPGSGILGSTNPMSLGSRQSAAAAYDYQFVGLMEEVAIYNYALSSAQVQAHYKAVGNRAPVFVTNPFTEPAIIAGQPGSGTIATNALDPNGDTLTFTKVSGPAWLSVAGNGGLSGTPYSSDVGINSFIVRAADPGGLSSSATLNINVTPGPPIIVSASLQGPNLFLSWAGGIAPYQVQVATNLTDPAWQPVGPPASVTNMLIPATNAAAFYRIGGQ